MVGVLIAIDPRREMWTRERLGRKRARLIGRKGDSDGDWPEEGALDSVRIAGPERAAMSAPAPR